MKQKLLAACFVIAGTFLSGCAGGGYYASYGPPPPRYRVIGVAPGPGYVWTQGFWDRSGNQWAWREGRWVRPPRAHAKWEAPHWERHGRNWRFHQGRWR
jgi:WXXGXW repeat (2 copies)